MSYVTHATKEDAFYYDQICALVALHEPELVGTEGLAAGDKVRYMKDNSNGISSGLGTAFGLIGGSQVALYSSSLGKSLGSILARSLIGGVAIAAVTYFTTKGLLWVGDYLMNKGKVYGTYQQYKTVTSEIKTIYSTLDALIKAPFPKETKDISRYTGVLEHAIAQLRSANVTINRDGRMDTRTTTTTHIVYHGQSNIPMRHTTVDEEEPGDLEVTPYTMTDARSSGWTKTNIIPAIVEFDKVTVANRTRLERALDHMPEVVSTTRDGKRLLKTRDRIIATAVKHAAKLERETARCANSLKPFFKVPK